MVAKGQVIRLQGAYISLPEIARLTAQDFGNKPQIRLLPAGRNDQGFVPRLVEKVAGGLARQP